MKKISELVNGGIEQYRESSAPSISAEAQSLVDLLFVAFEEHVKYFRLNHLEGNDRAKREWTKSFMECGISKERVQKGIRRIRASGSTYATITVGEFLALCAVLPEDIGSPDIGTAYLEACKNSNPCEVEKQWSHKAVQYATHKTGSYFLRTESRSVTYPVFEKNYLEACQMYFDGKILDQIGRDSPALRREIEETQKIVADGYEQFNCPDKALAEIKNLLR